MLDAALVAMVLAASACDRAAPERRADPGAAPTPYRHAPGPAYVAVHRAGVFRLDGGAFTRVLAHRYPVVALAVAPDGALFVSAIGGAWRIAGDVIERIDSPSMLTLSDLAIGPDGVLWATDGQAVFRWDGSWTGEPSATFDDAIINDLDVDPRGHVWVVQHDALWRLARDGWHQLDLGFTGTSTPFLESLAVAPDGALQVAGSAGAFAFRAGAWQTLPLPDLDIGPDHLTAGPAGHLAATSGLTTAILASPTGRVRVLDLAGTPAAARHLAVLAVDGAGRTWLTSDDGVIILADDGAVAQTWRPGSLPAITGRVTAAAVVGDGPALPALGPPRTGTVVGSITQAGRPAAGAAIELCDRPLPIFDSSPCAGASRTHRATADARGRFELTGVPAGTFGVAVRADRWTVLLSVDCCGELASADRLDLGALTVR